MVVEHIGAHEKALRDAEEARKKSRKKAKKAAKPKKRRK